MNQVQALAIVVGVVIAFAVGIYLFNKKSTTPVAAPAPAPAKLPDGETIVIESGKPVLEKPVAAAPVEAPKAAA